MKIGVVIISILFFSSCSSMQDTVAAKGSGSKMTVEKDYDTVWKGLLEIIALSDLTLKSEDKKTGTILANKGMSFMSYGEHVAIFVVKADKKVTKVEVVYKKAMATNVFATNWEDYIIGEMTKKFM